MMATSKNIVFWNKHGQLSYHNRTIPGSSLAELLEYVLFPEEEEIDEPVGLHSFLKGLGELKIDKKLIKNHTVLAKIINQEKERYQRGGGSDSDDENQEVDDNEDPEEDDSDDDDDESESMESEMTTEDDNDEEDDGDGERCNNCESRDVKKHTLRRCPDCHWVDLHDQDNSLMECNGCESQQPVKNFQKTHTIRYCNGCGVADVAEHDDDEQSQTSDDNDLSDEENESEENDDSDGEYE